MGKDYHSSKSKLNLRDGIFPKPGVVPHESKVLQKCAKDSKRCTPKHAASNDKPFQNLFNEYPKPIRTFGPRHMQILSQFRISFIAYGLSTILATMYFCEWKAVLQYLPYYNGKYTRDD